MADRKEENLRELLEGFFDDEKSEEAAEDIRRGEGFFAEHRAPEPGSELIESIKAATSAELVCRRVASQRRFFMRVAAVFAAAAIITFSMLYIREGQTERPQIISSDVWESDNVLSADAELSLLRDEAEEIEDELVALRLGEISDYEDNEEFIQLETELEEINGDFWKG